MWTTKFTPFSWPEYGSGRELADIFLALPSKEEYPEYYEVIKSPMSLQLVLSRIKSGHYKTVDDFDREFQLIFENALIFNEDGSRINKDARVLLKLFNTRKKDIYASYKLVQNPKAAAADKVSDLGGLIFSFTALCLIMFQNN
ncbi:Bromodomain-containing protein [Dissophora ornata]|nr:Bromodomain-containing protein [Dissophora ornata]